MADQSVAVIAAGSGKIGGCIARELGARGYALVMMSSGGSAETLAGELGGTGLTGSVAEPSDLERLVAAAMDKHGRIDAVVNNTGHVPKGTGSLVGPVYRAETVNDLIELSDEDWHNSLDKILLNVVRMARLVTPIMQKQGGGAILNISSFAQKEPSPKFPIGAALRMAMAGYMKMYADRYAPENIRMNNLLPGFVGFDPLPAGTEHSIPMNRAATLEETGKTAAFLLSKDAGFITGQSILLDGGMNRGT